VSNSMSFPCIFHPDDQLRMLPIMSRNVWHCFRIFLLIRTGVLKNACFDTTTFPIFRFTFLSRPYFVPVFLTYVVSSLIYPNLIGTKRLGCWLVGWFDTTTLSSTLKRQEWLFLLFSFIKENMIIIRWNFRSFDSTCYHTTTVTYFLSIMAILLVV
jgi:hypothetical protein